MSKTPTPHKFGQVDHIDIPIDTGQIKQSDKSDVEEAEVASIVCIDDYVFVDNDNAYISPLPPLHYQVHLDFVMIVSLLNTKVHHQNFLNISQAQTNQHLNLFDCR